MFSLKLPLAAWMIVTSILAACDASWAADPASLKQQFDRYQQQFRSAGESFQAQRYQECKDRLLECRETLKQLILSVEEDRQLEALRPSYQQLAAAAAKLREAGVDIDAKAFPEWSTLVAEARKKADAADADPQPSGKRSAAMEQSKTAAPPGDAPSDVEAPSDEVSFARDVAPVLAQRCSGCHVAAPRVRGGLNMNTFAGLIDGGDSGPVVEAGDAAGSLLIAKVRGTADGQRMPIGRPPLDESAIQTIERWIDQGAKFDGGSENAALASVVEEAWIATATPEQMRQRRVESAEAAWRRAQPGREAFTAAGEQFVVMSDVSQAAANRILAAAASVAEQLAGSFKVRDGKLFPAGAAIFAFAKRYDYSEFGKMAESRDLPAGWDSHWRRSGVDAYVALQDDGSSPESLEGRLRMQLAALWASGFEGTPGWFADGLGRHAYASKVGKRDESVARWNAAAETALRALPTVKPLLEGKINEDDAAAIGFRIVQAMNQRDGRRNFDSLLKRLQTSRDFEEAFASIYGPPAATLALWFGKPAN